MKIIRLNAENFKRLVAVEITPTGNVVEIAGKNGQGKSSILDAIWVALAGMSVAPKQPIRKGELEARIELTLGTDKPEIIVTRTFRPSKDGADTTTTLKVESADGARFSSPQEMLNKLLGALTFDPLAFDKMDAKAQFNTLRAFVPSFDFEATEAAQRGDYDRRTHQNRIAKEKRAAAQAIKVVEVGEKIDEAALVAELENAGKHNTDIETRKANRIRIGQDVAHHANERDRITAEVAVLMERIDALRVQASEHERTRAEKQAKLDAAPPLPEPIDTTALRLKIESARQHNTAVFHAARAKSDREALIAAAQEAEAAAARLTESIDMREIAKRDAIAAAKLPVSGISFGDNAVLLNGVPWEQGSDAERLVASMQMAMAMNPKLRIVRVRDGSLLDGDSMEIVAAMAAQNDFQVWIERVDGSGRVGVVIENGQVKSTSQGSTA